MSFIQVMKDDISLVTGGNVLHPDNLGQHNARARITHCESASVGLRSKKVLISKKSYVYVRSIEGKYIEEKIIK
ncbi:hypothetical protein CVD25_09100 [Bacillus canaveralius]|uniref:Uncharacterized protein n=1 Tax=Bacillus canaveralius TaxID=1403243 RepID=A0A2N5GKU6_9BACI|nr:hypothetical protein CU635_13240 [Bacillus canaveralius]PLR83953.1 hypothetical protein CVD23_12460 [Bacillus sp. V33-4]PLR97968.1 hypothetical protein CVD25_09100 [Bacillus canaveralius]